MRLQKYKRNRTKVTTIVMTLHVEDNMTSLVIVILFSSIAFLILLLSVALAIFIARAKQAN